MRSTRRIGSLAVAGLVAALMVAACGGGNGGGSGGGGGGDAAGSAPIKIGVLLELTGPGSDYGTRGKDMIEMLVKEYGGKIGDHPIQVTYADTATTPATAVTKVRQLVQRDKVDVTFGPVFSDAQDAIAPYLATQKKLAMAPIGANWTLSKYKNWVVFPGTLESFCGPGGQALRDSGHGTMATIGADYVAGHQFIDPIAKSFKDGGGRVVQQQWAPLGTSDFGSYISSLKKSDVLAAWTIMPDELAMMQAFTKFKSRSNTDLFLCEAENVTSAQLKETGKGILGTTGMIGSYSPDIENAANTAFIAKVKETYNRTPVIGDGTNYLLFKTLLEGLKKTGGDASLDVLRPAILGMSQDTVAGPVSWSKNGFAVANRYLATVTDQGGTYVWKTDKVFEKVRDPRDTE
jgi:branched-chain amino acid transport system substrate-binding protein